MLPPLNITFLHKVLDQAILKSIKSLFLHEESKNNWYVEKDMFEKVEKCPLNIAVMLIFYLQEIFTPHEISISRIKYHKYWKYVALILLY